MLIRIERSKKYCKSGIKESLLTKSDPNLKVTAGEKDSHLKMLILKNLLMTTCDPLAIFELVVV